MTTASRHPVTTLPSTVTVIEGDAPDPYRDKVVNTYADDPDTWRKALGDTCLFEWGIYEGAKRHLNLGEAGIRFFDRQLHHADLLDGPRTQIRRILDLGCGWGFITYLLARRFHEAERIDAVNISPQQLSYCADYLADHDLSDRIKLYLCNGQDIDRLPNPESPYDLVVIRGVYTHFRNDVFERSVKALASRVRPGGTVIISDTLFKGDLDGYTSKIPDEVDRLACGNRKTPEYFADTIRASGFTITDMRILPSNADVAHWFSQVKTNIQHHFPAGVTGPLEELRVMADNMSAGLLHDKVSAYSIIARRSA
ncbi:MULTISPECIES: cyclopropane-fatty-acyl-phospholipid synthase family protein [unclassified Streptomyces]|uniref:SAM-dependent methyltransferase n=1 Tax=unclassified Streptomyces TaxID=2593676 RepID=UPI0009404713|nr:class I SAM-dependent methyltransferase [Streptomyces sp. TSRI0281]OKI40113.1 methyltransferase type 12 [Streptomyces sp. TSRI0281]